MKVRPQSGNVRRAERGYILLTLLLMVTLLIIGMAVVLPEITFQVKRDREEEMIHRGVQYSRAIRRYVKKFGRYPTRIEELENTNNIRFLRKRYKDPITRQDFKLLHVGEVQLTPGAGIAGATPASAMPGALGQQQPANQSGQPATTDANQPDQAPADGQAQPDQAQPGQSKPSSGNNLSGQVFGGGPIVGVASTSKAQTIREFNHKNHYNQWQFIYDPSTDRGGLLNTPAQPPLQGALPVAGAPANGMQSPQQGQQPQQSAPPANVPPPDQQQQQ